MQSCIQQSQRAEIFNVPKAESTRNVISGIAKYKFRVGIMIFIASPHVSYDHTTYVLHINRVPLISKTLMKVEAKNLNLNDSLNINKLQRNERIKSTTYSNLADRRNITLIQIRKHVLPTSATSEHRQDISFVRKLVCQLLKQNHELNILF